MLTPQLHAFPSIFTDVKRLLNAYLELGRRGWSLAGSSRSLLARIFRYNRRGVVVNRSSAADGLAMRQCLRALWLGPAVGLETAFRVGRAAHSARGLFFLPRRVTGWTRALV